MPPTDSDDPPPDSSPSPSARQRRREEVLPQTTNGRDTPSTPGQLADFDWDDFEARYERALQEADEHEREILQEAQSLSKVS